MITDQPSPVRPGEELPQEPLRAYLERELGQGGALEVLQFPRGFSNLTYLLRLGGQELVLRRPPVAAAAKGGHDMAREHRVLGALAGVYPKAPRPLLLCEDEGVIGAPFFVMERVRGVILRDGEPPAGLVLGAETMRRASGLLADTLAELHALDVRSPPLLALGRPDGYLSRQVEGWSERYRRARTDEVGALATAARWLADHQPAGSRTGALVHNDFKYDNLVLEEGLAGVRAVLDWEMATLGDPLLDLGTTLAYWLDPEDPPGWRDAGLLTLTRRPGHLRRSELVDRYARGRDVGDVLFGYVFGVFKVAVIAQQIYRRFQQGATRDPRFAALSGVVRACGAQAVLAIERGRIDRLG